MSAALVAFVQSIWPVLAGGAVAFFGLLVAWAKGKAADTKVAQAGHREAAAKQEAADVKAQAERDRAADAKSQAAAAQSAADAAGDRAAIDSRLEAMSREELQNAVNKWRTPE